MLGLFSQKFCPDCVTALMFSEGSIQGAVINKKLCCNSTDNWIIKGRWLHNTDGELACKIEYTYQNEYIVSFSYQPEGGNGYFTQLLHIKDVDNQYVLLNPIARGDRCMGGVVFEKISVKGDYLYYSIHVDYSDVLTWIKDTTQDLKTTGCPACCDGIANYKYNPKTKKVLSA